MVQVGRAGRLGAPGCAVTFINNSNKSLFLGLHGMLARLGVAIPPELLTSPYLALQLEERKRKMADSGGEESSKTPGSKRRKTDRFVRMIEAVHSFTFNIFLQKLGWYAGSCQFSAEKINPNTTFISYFHCISFNINYPVYKIMK